MRQKIGAQSEAEHGNIALVDYSAQLVYLSLGKKLALVGDNDVGVSAFLAEHFIYIVLRGNSLRLCAQTHAGIHGVRAVSCVDARLYQPYRAVLFFIVEFGHEPTEWFVP